MVDTSSRVDVEAGDDAVAAKIAAELRRRSGRRGQWMEVRSLMGEFDIDRLSDQARRRIERALERVGLRAEPALSSPVTRRDTVVLHWLDGSAPSAGATASAGRHTPAEVMILRVAEPGQPFREVDPSGEIPPGVRWFDIKETSTLDPRALLDAINVHCELRLDLDMVVDLLTPDPRPKVTPYEEGAVRGASAFRVRVEESDEGAGDENPSKAGVLVFEPVEMIVAEGWIVSCWHEAEVYRGAQRLTERKQVDPANLSREVERWWQSKGLRTGGDLATALLYELSLTFQPAVRELQSWEAEWELDFFRRPDRLDRHTLLEAHAAVAVLRDWLVPLNRPGMRQDIERAWFPAISGTVESGGWERAMAADERIGRALKVLVNEIGPALRSAYDLLGLRETERERVRDERFQRAIAIGGAAILIPTLVAGVMGANTWVPGEYEPHQSHWPFVILLVLVIASGVSAWLLLSRAQRRRDE